MCFRRADFIGRGPQCIGALPSRRGGKARFLATWEQIRAVSAKRAFVFRPFAARQAHKADGPEDKTFKSPLQAVMFSGKMEGRFRMFIARTKASNRCVQFRQQRAQASTYGAGF